MSKEEKQKLREYQKNYCEAKKYQYNKIIKKIVLRVYTVIQLHIINSITFMLTIHTDGDKSLIMHD